MHFRDSSTRLGLRALWFTGAALALAACNNGGGHHAAVVSDAFEGARVITPATAADDLFDPSINGSRAEGKVGDVVMANSRIKVIIQAPGRDEGVGPQGGTIIDADIRRPAGEEGMDSLAEITPMFRTLRESRKAKPVNVRRNAVIVVWSPRGSASAPMWSRRTCPSA